MEYISTKEASAKWGISTTRITILANEGRIPGAQKFGKNWLIPVTASKPPEIKPNRSHSAVKEIDNFSFPLYHFRPDWSYIKEAQISEQQKSLLLAETAVLECRFTDAYQILTSIMDAPDDIYTEIGILWNAGICCIALNKPDDFSRFYLRLQIIFSGDFKHRDDLMVILQILNTYVESIGSTARITSCNTDVHDQSIPLTLLLAGYMDLSKEAMKPGTLDTTLLEINLRLLKNTSAVIAMEMMHGYLLGIYYIRDNIAASEKHAKELVHIVFETKLYFPLVTYYRYFAPALSPILSQYPEDFQEHCHKMISQFEENFTAFLSTMTEHSVIAKLDDTDYPYIYGTIIGLSNDKIAKKIGVSKETARRKIASICEKLDVNDKKKLKEFLQNFM